MDETRILLERCHAGDAEALARLIERDQQWIWDQARRELGDALRARCDSLDLVSETIHSAVASLPSFTVSDRQQFRRLMATIVRNRIADAARFHGAQRRSFRRERPVQRDTILSLDPPKKKQAPPDEQAAEQERLDLIRFAVEYLDDDSRLLVKLRLYEDLPFEDIAAELGINAKAAQKRHERALLKVSELYFRLKSSGLAALQLD